MRPLMIGAETTADSNGERCAAKSVSLRTSRFFRTRFFFLFISLAFENPKEYHSPRFPEMGQRETLIDL